jgi:TrmH family RNA methyltransferase
MSIAIVLVRPEISQNVGFVARTMKCYNLTDLKIVGRKYSKISYAYKTGYTASRILDRAGYFKTLQAAISDCHTAIGFTRRRRDGIFRRIRDLVETVPAIDFSKKTALVFGRESVGLSKEDCLFMDQFIKIELPNSEISLNLSHAVAVVLHEIFSHSLISGNPLSSQKAGTTKALFPKAIKNHVKPGVRLGQREESYQTFMRLLEAKKIFKPSKLRAHRQYIRNLWQRAQPGEKELEFILGLIEKGAAP